MRTLITIWLTLACLQNLLAAPVEATTTEPDYMKQFVVRLPDETREFPEPLKEGDKPGFQWRGTKGWLWKPNQYLSEIPYIAKCRMNFLMNCYGSMCDIEHKKWGDPQCNRWYEPLPDEKKRAYEEVVREAQKAGLTFCFSMNPNLSSSRFVNSGKPEDIDALWQHYSWMQGLGVKWFNISLDDITTGIDARGQAHVVNEILKRLREKDADVQMIFCPTFYWGNGKGKDARPYLEALAPALDKDVYLFWTGGEVVGDIHRGDAETFKQISKHRVFLWDNYPVNDSKQTMHLGPVVGRDEDLCEVVDGYMCNPHHTQNEINRIPMYTCADYAYNPKAYDPMRSIGQAILQLEPQNKDVMADMVNAYPGMLVWGNGDTGCNPVRDRMTQVLKMPHNHTIAEGYARNMMQLVARFDKAFPDRYTAEKKTLKADLRWLEKQIQ
jgi:hypothetical protein